MDEQNFTYPHDVNGIAATKQDDSLYKITNHTNVSQAYTKTWEKGLDAFTFISTERNRIEAEIKAIFEKNLQILNAHGDPLTKEQEEALLAETREANRKDLEAIERAEQWLMVDSAYSKRIKNEIKNFDKAYNADDEKTLENLKECKQTYEKYHSSFHIFDKVVEVSHKFLDTFAKHRNDPDAVKAEVIKDAENDLEFMQKSSEIAKEQTKTSIGLLENDIVNGLWGMTNDFLIFNSDMAFANLEKDRAEKNIDKFEQLVEKYEDKMQNASTKLKELQQAKLDSINKWRTRGGRPLKTMDDIKNDPKIGQKYKKQLAEYSRKYYSYNTKLAKSVLESKQATEKQMNILDSMNVKKTLEQNRNNIFNHGKFMHEADRNDVIDNMEKLSDMLKKEGYEDKDIQVFAGEILKPIIDSNGTYVKTPEDGEKLLAILNDKKSRVNAKTMAHDDKLKDAILSGEIKAEDIIKFNKLHEIGEIVNPYRDAIYRLTRSPISQYLDNKNVLEIGFSESDLGKLLNANENAFKNAFKEQTGTKDEVSVSLDNLLQLDVSYENLDLLVQLANTPNINQDVLAARIEQCLQNDEDFAKNVIRDINTALLKNEAQKDNKTYDENTDPAEEIKKQVEEAKENVDRAEQTEEASKEYTDEELANDTAEFLNEETEQEVFEEVVNEPTFDGDQKVPIAVFTFNFADIPNLTERGKIENMIMQANKGDASVKNLDDQGAVRRFTTVDPKIAAYIDQQLTKYGVVATQRSMNDEMQKAVKEERTKKNDTPGGRG